MSAGLYDPPQDPAVQAIWEQEGWAPGAPIGPDGDAGIGQMIPSTARVTLARHPDLIQQFPDIHGPATAQGFLPAQDPLATYLNQPGNQRAAAALSIAHINDLKSDYPGWEQDPSILGYHYNGSGKKAQAYGERFAARYAQLHNTVQTPGGFEELAGSPSAQMPGVPPPTPSVQPVSAQGPMPQQPQPDDPYAEYYAAEKEQEKAIKGAADHATQAAGQEADLYRTMATQMPPPPGGQRIDPKQYYANIGQALGAKDPGTQRLIGGIATGLFAGLGTLGAAISRSHNDAADIIRDGISQNIAAQNQNNQLSHQQWQDQYDYMLRATEMKIHELSAGMKGTQAQDNAQGLIAQLHLDRARNILQNTLLNPEQAQKQQDLEEAKEAMDNFAQSQADSLSGKPVDAIEASDKYHLATLAWAKAMAPSPRQIEFYQKQAEDLMGGPFQPDTWNRARIGSLQAGIARHSDLNAAARWGINTYRPNPPGAVRNSPTGQMPIPPRKGPPPVPVPGAPKRPAAELIEGAD